MIRCNLSNYAEHLSHIQRDCYVATGQAPLFHVNETGKVIVMSFDLPLDFGGQAYVEELARDPQRSYAWLPDDWTIKVVAPRYNPPRRPISKPRKAALVASA